MTNMQSKHDNMSDSNHSRKQVQSYYNSFM